MIKIDCCKFPVCPLHWSFDALSSIPFQWFSLCVVALSLGHLLGIECLHWSSHQLALVCRCVFTFPLVKLKRQLLWEVYRLPLWLCQTSLTVNSVELTQLFRIDCFIQCPLCVIYSRSRPLNWALLWFALVITCPRCTAKGAGLCTTLL